MSLLVNTGLSQSIITKNDAMDFYTSWVFRCVDLRSNGLGAIDFKLYRLKKNNEVEEILEHELLDLLYRVNPDMTKFDFFKMTGVYHDIFGASPWILDGGKGGRKPQNIYIVRPEYLKVKKDKEGHTIGYEYRIGQKTYNYEKEEVINLKNYNPSNPDKGLGIIEAARTAAQHNDYIGQHNTKLLENGARPSGYLEVEKALGDKEHKRLKKEFKAEYQGYENAYKVLLLEGGVKFTPAMIPPKDLEFIMARELNRDEIAGIFGVPKTMLGYNDATRASAVTAEYIFAKWTLEPLIIKYFEQLNEFLVPRYGDDLWLWFEPLAKEDAEILTATREKAWNKWKTTNEIRAEEGLEPVNGGDQIYMPLSNMPLIGNNPPQKQIVELQAKSAIDVNLKTQKWVAKRILNRNVRIKNLAKKATDKTFDNFLEKKKIVFKIVPRKKALSDEQIDAFYKSRMNEEAGLEGLWNKTFIDFFEKQEQRFLTALEEGKKDLSEDYGISAHDELKATVDIISPLMYETVMRGTKQASELIGQPSIIDMDFIKAWLADVAAKTGESINETTLEAFEKTLSEGIANGESLAELKTRVEAVFADCKGYKAERIARTETARGVTEAHRKMYEYYGFDEVKWLLSPGACAECVVKASDNWTVKTIEGQIPVHPNCKCDHTPL